jgi:hypothetical protein
LVCRTFLVQRATVSGRAVLWPINDPCCGVGTIPEAAYRAGIGATGCDLVDRGYKGAWTEDFFASTWPRENIVSNPPFDVARQFVLHALKLTGGKVAIIFPTQRLNAANGPKGKYWIRGLPLRRVWLLTPRPSMPRHTRSSMKNEKGPERSPPRRARNLRDR